MTHSYHYIAWLTATILLHDSQLPFYCMTHSYHSSAWPTATIILHDSQLPFYCMTHSYHSSAWLKATILLHDSQLPFYCFIFQKLQTIAFVTILKHEIHRQSVLKYIFLSYLKAKLVQIRVLESGPTSLGFTEQHKILEQKHVSHTLTSTMVHEKLILTQ